MAARINLSVPEELKERMDMLADVNWSKVAQESFETHVRINELKEQNMTTEAGLERLRASKKTNGEREFAEGVAAGKKWAIERAEYDELARVAAVNDSEYEVGGLDLVAAILNDDKPSQMEWKDTMEEVLGAAEPSDDMVLGFIQGAAEVFDDV